VGPARSLLGLALGLVITGRKRGGLVGAALTVLLPLACSGCFTGGMMLHSESFRDRCAEDDTCVQMVAVEAVAEVGAAILILGGAAIAAALQDDPEEPLEGAEAAEPEPEEAAEPSRRRNVYPDWP